VLDHSVDDLGGVLRTAGDEIETAGGQAGVFKGTSERPVRAGGEFGGLEDGGVTGGEGAGGGADAEDVGGVPANASANL
jgi:hypothetical protein